jgi:SAM-dependent methyltransferase
MPTEYDAFAATYDVEVQATEDIGFYTELAQAAQPPVLELAVGTGRVSFPIARAGVPVIGVDRSAAMLAVAREKLAQEPELPVRLVEGDMKDFDLPDVKGKIGLAIIPARAFMHLVGVDAQIGCLHGIHRHLADGGRLALNFFVPDVTTIASYLGKLGRAVSYNDVFTDPDTGHQVEVWQYRSYRVNDQFIDQRFVCHEWGEDGTLVRTTRRGYTLCYIWPREFEHLLARCGFEVEALYGWFDKRPFDEQSKEQVWMARKQA